MTVSEVMEKMIKESKGSFRDINHFLKVWGYARNIGKGENLDDNTQKTLEIAAIFPALRSEKSMVKRTVKSRKRYLHR